jgi:hypothetical protein
MLLVMRTLVDDVFLVVFFGSTIQYLQHTQQRHDAEKFSHVYIESFCSAVIVRLHIFFFFFFSLLAISCFPADDKVHISLCLTCWTNHCRIHGSVLHRRWRWKQKWKQRLRFCGGQMRCAPRNQRCWKRLSQDLITFDSLSLRPFAQLTDMPKTH